MVPLQRALLPVVSELLHQGPLSLEKIRFAWQIAVGDALAKVTSLQLTPSGLLQVTADDERWRREIKRSTPVILTRLETLLGKDVIPRFEVTSRGRT